MPETLTQGLFLLVAVIALATVLRQHLVSRKRRIPPSAANDTKARRLWRGDPEAYERKFGDIDRQLEAKAREDSKAGD